jgi:hypothetical protein
MPIELTQPITVAKEVTRLEHLTFTSAWITRLEVVSLPSNTSLRAVFAPWEPTTNECDVNPDNEKELVIPDVFAAAQNDPQLAQAVGIIIAEIERQAHKMGVL